MATAVLAAEYAEHKYDTIEPEYVHHQVQASASHGHHEQPHHYKHIPILKSTSLRDKDGSYQYGFEAANGIQQHEQGYVKNAGQKEHEIQVAEGFYSYTDEHGHQIGVHYVADENGFRATGDHLPTPPPMPAALKEAFANVAAHPELYQHQPEEEQEHEYAHLHHQAYASHQHPVQEEYQPSSAASTGSGHYKQ